jgi:hypothetical protein
MLDTFWKKSLKEEQRGMKEAEIILYEKQIGFNLPNTFKELYKIQNGGRPRKESYNKQGKLIQLFGEPVKLEPMQKLPHDFLNMRNWIIAEWGEDDEDIETLSDTNFNNLERLIFISYMYGHSWMLFDYGWKQKEILIEPNILFLTDNFDETLRIKDFNTFINGLEENPDEY